VTEPAELTARVDETAALLPGGRLTYGVAAIITSQGDREALVDGLAKMLLPYRAYLHY
jgi:hypothetical protein